MGGNLTQVILSLPAVRLAEPAKDRKSQNRKSTAPALSDSSDLSDSSNLSDLSGPSPFLLKLARALRLAPPPVGGAIFPPLDSSMRPDLRPPLSCRA